MSDELEKMRLRAEAAEGLSYSALNLIADIRAAAGDKEGRLMQSELVELIARQREECEQARAAEASGRGPIAWECTGQGLKKYVTDKQYKAFTAGVRKWYKPYRCTNCESNLAPQLRENLDNLKEKAVAVFNLYGDHWDLVDGGLFVDQSRVENFDKSFCALGVALGLMVEDDESDRRSN